MNYQRALDVIKKVYPQLSHLPLKDAVRTAYLGLLKSHDGCALSLYRKIRKDRIMHCPEDYHQRLRSFLRCQNYEKSYQEIEAMEKYFSNLEIPYEMIVSSVVALMYDTSNISKGYLWWDTPFQGFTFSKDNIMSLYAHTHFVVDNEDFSKSFNDVMWHTPPRNIYKYTFEITNKFSQCNFTLGLPKEQTLVAGHTVWRVQEHVPQYDINLKRIVHPTTFTFVKNNNRIVI